MQICCTRRGGGAISGQCHCSAGAAAAGEGVAARAGKKDNARQWVEHWRAIEYYMGTFDVASVPERLFTDDLLDRAIGQAGVGG